MVSTAITEVSHEGVPLDGCGPTTACLGSKMAVAAHETSVKIRDIVAVLECGFVERPIGAVVWPETREAICHFTMNGWNSVCVSVVQLLICLAGKI